MSIQLLIAPAASGKTRFVLEMARQRARNLQAEVRVCAATRLQASAWQRRLAEAGGAIGVHVHTFDSLTAAILNQAAEPFIRLSDPVQHRLIRALTARLPLDHYRPLVGKPGFTQVLNSFFQELKSASISPAAFSQALAEHLPEPRLQELGMIYDAYQQQLTGSQWVDWVGQTWLASELLRRQGRHIGSDWPLLIIDGFDDFTPAQIDLLGQLAPRAGETIFTLSGPADVGQLSRHRRFRRTRQLLESTFDISARPLPAAGSSQHPSLRHLSQQLFAAEQGQPYAGECRLEMMALPDRAAEARAAMRWLKRQLLSRQIAPGDALITARDIEPYRPYILECAAEFKLPVRLVAGRPLGASPAIAALLGLIGLNLPGGDGGEPTLSRRVVVESWRSPYFDWGTAGSEGEAPIGIEPGDAEILDSLARDGRITGRLSQWLEVMSADDNAADRADAHDEQSRELARRQALVKERFSRFWQRIQPPPGPHSIRDFVAWLEDLIGSDPQRHDPRAREAAPEPHSLGMIGRIRQAEPAEAALDLAAMASLKELLRGLVWAEQVLDSGDPRPIDFAAFYGELNGAVQSASYSLPAADGGDEILAMSVLQSRGVSFRAAALMGLAEGEFPATLGEDPFLRDADRAILSEQAGIILQPSTLSSEQPYFYDAVSRATEWLLLTRPRLADSGADWVASPFWEACSRISGVTPALVNSSELVLPAEAASWPELWQSVAADESLTSLRSWAEAERPGEASALAHASRLLAIRESRTHSIYQGDLRGISDKTARRFGPRFHWSPSKLEQFRSCGYWFFTRSALGLEPRQEPAEGTDVAQLGSIIHEIFESIYQPPADIPDADSGALPAYIRDKADPILDAAPVKWQFRETAYWGQQRQDVLNVVHQSVLGMVEIAGSYVPVQVEARFTGDDALVVGGGEGDSFKYGGLIDRVDRDDQGRVRIIDYKLGGESDFTSKAVAEGKKLQLPLYALAAQERLKLGPVVDGLYWHYGGAKAGRFRLADFEGGVPGAIQAALGFAWEAVHGARAGFFPPEPPAGGCPDYCAAAAYCWQYRPGLGG